MRSNVLNFINDIICNETPMGENASILGEEDLLKSSSMDSLGYAMFWLEISQEYKINEEYTNSIDYETYTVGDLINVCTRNIL